LFLKISQNYLQILPWLEGGWIYENINLGVENSLERKYNRLSAKTNQIAKYCSFISFHNKEILPQKFKEM